MITKFVILLVLIALWAIVLVPPYLRERGGSSSSFGGGFGRGAKGSGSDFAQQRFFPLSELPNHTVRNTSVESSAGSQSDARLGAPVARASRYASNVVELRPANSKATPTGMHIVDDFDFETPAEMIDFEDANPLGVPRTTRAARERRRHILMGLSLAAVVTLVCAIYVNRAFIPVHILFDLAFLGYVILLVRRQQMIQQRMAVSPIRKSVTEEPVRNIQLAPEYLAKKAL